MFNCTMKPVSRDDQRPLYQGIGVLFVLKWGYRVLP